MIIPPPSRAAARYYARNVRVPNSRRERLLHRFARTPDASQVQHDPLAALLFGALELEPLPGQSLREMRSVSLVDQDQDGRRRLLAFLFRGEEPAPFAIAKAQTDTQSGSLQHEADALKAAAAMLPPELRRTIPELLRCDINASGEIVIVSAVPGRSAWLDMRAALMPSRLVGRHFEAAGRWLSDFHESTRHDDTTTAKHGDYWAHNVLLDGDGTVSIVDWEHFAPRASRFADLFHYPLTYGLAYPWRLYRGLPAEEAFARTFVEPNRVSRAVRGYMDRYAVRTGLARETFRAPFRDFLRTHGAMEPSGPVHPGVRQLPWDRFIARFEAAAQSVFD